MTRGTTLENGAIVIDYGTAVNGSHIVLCVLPHNDTTPFATWQYNEPDAADTYWGHYFNELHRAVFDYERRLLK
jgi:methenyltetrahydromethanopterin cyclohydrolase